MGDQKKKNSNYGEAFKWEVVQSVLSGKFSKEEARQWYGIKSNCAVLYWMRSYSGNDAYRTTYAIAGNLAAMNSSKDYEALQQRVIQLEEALRRANLRADLWHTMIEVAEEKLGIDIKKKYGAQRSKRSGETQQRQK